MERDLLGNPKVETDFLGRQKIETDWKRDPYVPLDPYVSANQAHLGTYGRFAKPEEKKPSPTEAICCGLDGRGGSASTMAEDGGVENELNMPRPRLKADGSIDTNSPGWLRMTGDQKVVYMRPWRAEYGKKEPSNPIGCGITATVLLAVGVVLLPYADVKIDRTLNRALLYTLGLIWLITGLRLINNRLKKLGTIRKRRVYGALYAVFSGLGMAAIAFFWYGICIALLNGHVYALPWVDRAMNTWVFVAFPLLGVLAFILHKPAKRHNVEGFADAFGFALIVSVAAVVLTAPILLIGAWVVPIFYRDAIDHTMTPGTAANAYAAASAVFSLATYKYVEWRWH